MEPAAAAAADEVSVEQVRQHLQQMGFAAVPDALVFELRGELLARLSSAAPTPMHPSDKRGGHSTAAGYEADDSEWEQRDKENDGASEANKRKGATVGGGRDGCSVSANSRDPRPSTALKERERQQTSAHAARARGGRAAGGAQTHGNDTCAGSKENGVHEIEGVGVETVKDAFADEGRVRVRGGKGSPAASSSTVFSGARSVAGPSIIRPATQNYGRTPRRADPVSAFQKTKESWQHAPAVTAGGTARSSIGRIAALREPEPSRIWKAHHPLDNATSASGYRVPTTKARTREREQVRQSMAWNEVYKPPKTDRVQVNLESRQYVIPDDKRRDDVRWQARVMMHS